ncbi:MAG: hypothetical protein FJ091_16060 [Deltaproteobacteria bacterium]|nr:hypothetical protein [Deltaproteobacteria bacterium]
MPQQETLLSLAEISVALAGFAGLVAALGSFLSAERQLAAARVRAIAENGLIVLPFALLPLFVLGFGVEEEAAFRASSVCFLIGYGAHWSLVITRFARLAREGRYAFVFSSWVGIGFSVGALLVAFANSLGVFGSYVGNAYVVSLVGPLYNCALPFFRLLAAISIRDRAE